VFGVHCIECHGIPKKRELIKIGAWGMGGDLGGNLEATSSKWRMQHEIAAIRCNPKI
jgi:hypothetical protein